MKKLFILAAALLAFTLAACGEADGSAPGQSGGQTGSTSREAVVTIAYADEAVLPAGGFDTFSDEASAYQVRVVFSTDTAVKDFRFLKLGFAEGESGNGKFTVEEELYAADGLTPQRPLAVDMTFAETIPDRGISYVDENGAVKYYAVAMSGKDGSLLLMEFEK